MTRKLTLALIGAGRWGTNIRRTLEAFRDVRLAAVVTRDWRALLRLPNLDGVLIATPASTHARIALPFLRRGLPMFIEKPLASSLRDALALQRASRSRALVFVGHVHLYAPAYQVAKRHVRRLGKIRFLFGEGMNRGPVRDDISALWDWAPHDLALALDLLGETPRVMQVTGHAWQKPRSTLHDFASLTLRFPSGAAFHGVYSWALPPKRKRLTIVCDRGTVVHDDTAERKVSVHTPDGRVAYPRYASTPPLTAELRSFVRMIRSRKRPVSDLAQGLAVIRILDAAG